MIVMGIEFAGSNMNYVVIESNADNEVHIRQANRLVMGDTRSRDSLVSFQNAISTLFNATSPNLVGIKAKPEAGAMMAGAASLKMEGIVLANSPAKSISCQVLASTNVGPKIRIFMRIYSQL